MANIDIFDWRSLTASITKIAPVQSFLLDTVFKTKVAHVSDKVDIDLIKGSQKLAMFVNKNEGPHLVGKDTYQTLTFNLPRLYEKKLFTANELGEFKTGTAGVYAGSAQDIISESERYKLMELASLKDRITRRIEQMACSILSTGGLTVSQDNIDFTYNFDYHAGSDNQLPVLTGNYLWGGTTADIIGNIRTWKRNIFKKTGATPTIGLLGTTAATKFIADTAVLAMLDRNNQRAGVMDVTRPIINGSNYLGNILGIDWYEYSCPYIDGAGSAAEAFDAKLCVLVAPDDSFRVHSGPIYRLQPGGDSLTIQNGIVVWPVTDNYNTSLEWTIETKPLPAVHNPDRVIAATVTA